jgi:Glycosyl hydrolase family 20, catalytic domain
MSYLKVRLLSLASLTVSTSILQLNTFHWHITDSQSFPLSIADFPELAIKGSYSPHEVYSPDDVQDIVACAGAVSTLSFRRSPPLTDPFSSARH